MTVARIRVNCEKRRDEDVANGSRVLRNGELVCSADEASTADPEKQDGGVKPPLQRRGKTRFFVGLFFVAGGGYF
jgi:hypothetical protein